MRTIYFIIFFSAILCLNSNGQNKYASNSKKAIKYYEQAIEAFNTRDYEMVKTNLDKAIKKDSNFIDAYLLRAELYRINYNIQYQIYDLEKAVALNSDYFPYAQFNLGMAQLKLGKYSEAKDNFNNFMVLEKIKEKSKIQAKEFIKNCDFALNLIEKPVDFKPLSLGSSINTGNDQYWPSLSIDGNTLIYSTLLIDSTQRTITGHYAHQEDFYTSEKVDGNWSLGKPIGPPINTNGNEGALKISADGNSIVFTACNRTDGYGRCDIYSAHKKSDGWSNAKNLGKPINTMYSEKQPCLSADQNTLYFSSNRPDGFGAMDIWYSERDKEGYWSKPKNMGPTINTPYDEESPFFHPDNQTFYFSSDGHMGLGLKDIFYAKKRDSVEWSKPKNIGYPINTYQDEIGLFIDNTGETAFYSTNFGDSSRNIYQFTLPEKARPHAVSYLSGIVSDNETDKTLSAKIELLNASSGKKIMEVFSKNRDGKFLICIPSGTKYALNVSSEGYLFNSVHFDLADNYSLSDPYVQNIKLQPIKLNQAVVLENIFFESDSYKLKPESKAELIKIEDYIKNNPTWIFEIGGHTDQSGSSSYNLELSEKRAKTVYNYLINRNINPENIAFNGYGELKPISKDNSPKEKAKNRRTELKIIDRL